MDEAFLRNYTHESRTLLSAILACTDKLADQPVNNQAAKTITLLQNNSRHLLHLINNTLDLTKINAGKMSLERTPVRPDDLVTEVIALMEPKADEKGLILQTSTSGPIPATVQTDALRVRQILLNLVDNAIKFTGQGSVEIVLKMEGSSLQFQVRDTGIGIAADQLAHIFDPFVQAESSTTRQYGGTGLGLTISSQLAELLGGELTVDSEVGQGTTFLLSLPARTQAESKKSIAGALAFNHAGGKAPQTPWSQRPRGSFLEGANVLIVEDRPHRQLWLSAILKSVGVRIALAKDSREATSKIDAARDAGQPFHVVLLSMEMWMPSGVPGISRLREQGYQGSIVALTTGSAEVSRELWQEIGCDMALSEPFETDALINTLATVIKPHRGRNT